MVRTKDFRMDLGISNLWTQPLTGDEIVDAPAGILLTGLETVGPPRIGDLLGIKGAEGIDKSTGQQVGELLALLIGEAGIHTVGLGILQVNLLMSYIQVATQDDGLLLIQLLEIVAESVFPRHAVFQALQAVLRVGRIAAYQEEVLHLQRDDAPFVVVQVDADAIHHVQWSMACKNGCARVAFLLGIVPVRLVAFKLQVKLAFLHLRLLQTEEVGVQFPENIAEALALASPQSVHVPTNQLHIIFLLFAFCF